MGGSATRARLVERSGATREWSAPGGNLSLDREAARDILVSLLRDAAPEAACLGLAGARTAPQAVAWLAGELAAHAGRVTLLTDAELAIAAAFGPDADGIVLCAGTGSVAVVRKNGATELLGGYGFLLDDAGSAYDIGRRIVAAALHDRDRGRHDLVDELEGVLGEPIDGFVRRVYLRPADRAPLALLAERVPTMQHAAARDVLQQAADALVDLATLARDRFGPLPIRLMGGVFNSPAIVEVLRDRCDAALSPTRPEVAAARLAAGGAV
jgi:N-acetylglucosamine kinase-like BadF-type ATPase